MAACLVLGAERDLRVGLVLYGSEKMANSKPLR